MELSPSREAASCAATQELVNVLWNPKVHCRVHKSPPLVLILNRLSQVLTISFSLSVSLRSSLILSTHLHFDLPGGLFRTGRECYMH
jgi:hypothetical protein